MPARRCFGPPFFLFSSLYFFDTLVTWGALARGAAAEGNPLWAGLDGPTIAAMKGVLLGLPAASVYVVAVGAPDRNSLVRVAWSGGSVTYAVVGVWNARVLLRHGVGA